MSSGVDFEGRVAVISGAGRGLGREHALLFAARGGRVVVNDPGASLDGTGDDGGPAEKVAEEIRALGGEAVADTHSVATPDGAKGTVSAALEAWGQVDVVVNNAGILRDSSFAKMTVEDFEAVIDVHLKGSFYLTQSAWPHMREQAYGRILFTTSVAGLLGNFGQANYAAAKMGVVGLAQVLAIEGSRYNINANVIAPVARTRMTEELLGPLADRVDPRLVSPVVAWLCHQDCSVSGRIYTVGGGRVARLFVGMCGGWTRADGDLTVEDVRDHFEQINDTTDASVATALADDFRALARALKSNSANP